MKVLITGGSGLLGQYLNIVVSGRHEILTLYNNNSVNCRIYNAVKMDLTDTPYLKRIFISFMPDVVIHTSAISRPETCDELPRDHVMSINVNSTVGIAKLSKEFNTKIIYTSTDLVYDGDLGGMLSEESKLNPVSLYAQTKLQSEYEIRNITENHIILRTSLLYGLGLNHSTNNFHNMYSNFLHNKHSKLFYDQFRTPMSLMNAAEVIEQLINPAITNITLNFGGSERVSRAELGYKLCEVLGFDKSLIIRTSMHETEGIYKVADVSMNTQKLQSLGVKQKSIDQSLREMKFID